MTVLFVLLAAITIAGAAATMAMRNAVHCVLALAVGLVGIAAVYLELGAQFVGFTQVLVYVGAVAILAVFAIMTTQDGNERTSSKTKRRIGLADCSGIAIAGGVFGVFAWSLGTNQPGAASTAHSTEISVREIGVALMSGYALPLEIVGLLLTAAMVGAVIVAMPEKGGKP